MSNDTVERELARVLTARVEQLHEAPFGLAEVRARAVGIRRRRRVATAVATVAAVAAIAVPAGVLGGGDGDRDRVEPAGPVDTTVPYIRDGVLVRGDVSLRLPVDTRTEQVSGLVTLSDGRAVVATSTGGRDGVDEVMVIDDEGQGVAALSVRGDVVGTPDGSAAAWLTWDGVPVLVRPGEPPRELVEARDGAPGLEADAVHCTPECTVTASLHRGGGLMVREFDEDGTQRSLDMLSEIDDVSADGERYVDLTTVAGQRCAALYEPARGAVDSYAWTDCGHRGYEFSPDGAWLAAWEDGPRLGVLSVIEAASGEVRTSFAGTALLHAVWEDSSHLLALAYAPPDGWTLVRVGLDGEQETLLGPVPGTMGSPSWQLPNR